MISVLCTGDIRLSACDIFGCAKSDISAVGRCDYHRENKHIFHKIYYTIVYLIKSTEIQKFLRYVQDKFPLKKDTADRVLNFIVFIVYRLIIPVQMHLYKADSTYLF